MTSPKFFLPVLAAAACLSGCVYEEYGTAYEEPRRVYRGGGYVQREVVVERHPVRYYDDRPRAYTHYDERPRAYTHYDEPPRVYHDHRPQPYVRGAAIHHDHHGESWDERRRREIREAQRAHAKHEKKKDDDHKKKKKKKDD